MRRGKLLTGSLLAVAAVAAGCGSDSEETTTTERPTETAERAGKLPPGWETVANDSQGFEIGVPPGWGEGDACGSKAPRASTGLTLLCSPDRLVTLQISVDRTDEALSVAPDEAATRTAEAISEARFDGELELEEPRPAKGHYAGASVTGDGRAGEVEQGIEVYALQRDDLAAITAIVAFNADEKAEAGAKLAERAIESLRTQPVGS
jgi:hypothetical protein